MAKINIVLEGRCKGDSIWIDKKGLGIGGSNLNKTNISSYIVIDKTNIDQYSFWKGVLGVALLGEWGVVAGLNGKDKEAYLIEIEWIYPKNSSNNKSLILLDGRYYQTLVRSMF